MTLLANRRRIRARNIEQAEFEQFSRDAEPEHVADIEYNSEKRTLQYTLFGYLIEANSERPEEPISPYQAVATQFVPGLPPPRTTAKLLGRNVRTSGYTDWLQQNKSLHKLKWSWSSVLDNLVLNEIATSLEREQIEAHYGFLSQFVHGYPNKSFGESPIRSKSVEDRLRLEEIVLLYGITTLRLDAEATVQYFSRRERLRPVDVDTLVSASQKADLATAYFWFRGGEPTEYDKQNEAQQRHWHDRGFGDAPTSGSFEPMPAASLTTTDLHYYQDPWVRLAKVSPFGVST